nr:methyl-accepting chemotaxis protein [Lachnospiraceae bacterium]
MDSKPKRLFKFDSIKTKLIITMLLIASIPLVISVIINYNTSTRKAKVDAQEALLTETRYIEAEIGTIFSNTVKSLKAIATSPTTIDAITNKNQTVIDGVKKQMEQIDNEFADGNVMVVSDINGQMLIRSDNSELTNIASRSYFKDAIKGNVVVSPVLISNSTKIRSISVALPIYDASGRSVIGVIHRNYNMDDFHSLLAANTDEAFVIDNDGYLAAHAQYSISAQDEPTSFKDSPYMTTTKKEDVFISTKMETPKYVAYVKEPISGFTICNAVSVNDVISQARRSAFAILGVGLLLLIVVALVSLRLAIGFTKPIIEMDGILAQLADGRFMRTDKYINRNDEFGQMVRNSNTVMNRLEEIVTEIKASSEKVDTSSDGLSVMATQIAATTETVAEAVQEIAQGATDQALSIQRSAEHTGKITNAVENVRESASE